MQDIAYFSVFAFPLLALYGCLQGGLWAWAFVPVLVGLVIVDAIVYVWKRGLRGRVRAGAEGGS